MPDTNEKTVETNTIVLTKDQLVQISESVTKAAETNLSNITTTLREDLKKELVAEMEVERIKFLQKNSNPLGGMAEQKETSESFEKMIMKSVYSAFDAKDHENTRGNKGMDFVKVAEKTYKDDELLMKAIQNTSTGADGGVLIRPAAANFVIPYLHNAETFFNDIPEVAMPSGGMTIPKELTAPTVSWNGETEAGTVSSITFGDVKFNTKRIDVIIPMSNQLLRYDGIVNVEEWIKTAMRNALIPALEGGILTGDGNSNHFLGIYNTIPAGNKMNQTGVTPELIGTDLGNLEELVEGNNISPVKGTYVMSTRSKNHLKNLYTDLGIPSQYMNEMNKGMLNGYKAYATNTILNTYNGATETGGTASRVYFFDASKLIKGVSRNMSLEVHPYGNYIDAAGSTIMGLQRDLTVITLRFEMDFGMWYKEAAAVLEAVTW